MRPSRKRREFERAALEHLDALYGVALRLSRDEQNAKISSKTPTSERFATTTDSSGGPISAPGSSGSSRILSSIATERHKGSGSSPTWLRASPHKRRCSRANRSGSSGTPRTT